MTDIIGYFYLSPGPMYEIRSDSRVRTRGFNTITSNSSYDSDSYFTNKAYGSDSKIRSDFRHWTRANIRPVRPNPWSNLWWNVSGKSLYQNLTQLDVNKQNTVLDQKILRGIFTWSEPYPNFLSPFLNYFQRKTVWKFQIVYLKRAFSLKESMKNDQK